MRTCSKPHSSLFQIFYVHAEFILLWFCWSFQTPVVWQFVTACPPSHREFTLVLTPNDDSMGNKVRVHLVGSNGQRRTVDPDSLQREMYHGYVKG